MRGTEGLVRVSAACQGDPNVLADTPVACLETWPCSRPKGPADDHIIECFGAAVFGDVALEHRQLLDQLCPLVIDPSLAHAPEGEHQFPKELP